MTKKKQKRLPFFINKGTALHKKRTAILPDSRSDKSFTL